MPVRGDPWRPAAATAVAARPPPFYALLGMHAVAASALLPALLAFHVDIGQAGSHTGACTKVACTLVAG